MFCKKCGAQLEDNAVFCSECGTPVEQETANETVQETVQPEVQVEETVKVEAESVEGTGNNESKKSNMKGIVGIVAAVVVAIIVIKLIASLFGGSADYVMTVYDSEEGKSTVYLNDKKIETVDGSATVYTNMDSNVFYVEDGDSTLYYVKGSKLEKVMSDVSQVVVANHSEAALIMNDDGELYKCEKAKTDKIYDDEEYITNAVISGNGNYYCYTVSDDDSEAGVSYIGKKAGKEEKIKDFTVAAISEDGKYTYGTKYNDDYESNLLVADKKGKTETIAKGIEDVVGFNEDGTEIMFTQDDKTFISNKGKDKVKVTGDSVYGVYYKKTSTIMNGYFYPVKSFKKTAIYGGGKLSLVNGKYEAEEVIDDVSSVVRITDDFSKVIFVSDDSELSYAKIKKNTKAKVLAEDVSYSAWASYDGKDIYFLNDDEELNYISGTGKAKEVSGIDEVSSYNGYVCDGTLYIQNSDEDGWYAVDGKKGKELDVDSLTMSRKANKVFAYKDGKLFNVNGTKLKEMKGDFDSISGISIR